MSTHTIQQDLIAIGKSLYLNRYVTGKGGNLSTREGNLIYITGSGKSLSNLTPNSFSQYDLTTHSLLNSLKPSSELPMHLGIYKARPDVKYIIHAHPIKLTAFAVAGVPLNPKLIPEQYVAFGQIPLLEYQNPSSQELSDVVATHILNSDTLILANHGVIVVDNTSILDAFYKLETLEAFAEISIYAKLLGNTNEIPEDQLQTLLQLYKK